MADYEEDELVDYVGGDLADYDEDDLVDYAGGDLADYEEDEAADDAAANDGRRTENRELLLKEPGPSSSTESGAPDNGAALATGGTMHGEGEAGGESTLRKGGAPNYGMCGHV